MADLLDDETFKIGYEDEDARIHRVGGHQEIKRQLHVFLANQEYRSAWSALEKLIKMDKPDVSEYYEIAAEILRGAAPSLVAEFLEFAYISTRKLKKLDIFAAWMEALLEQGDYSRVIGEIDIRIHSKEYAESTKIHEVLCMAYYRRYKKIPIKKHLAAAISVFTRAYEMIPNNTKYFNILFELLQTAGDKKRVQQLAHHEIEAMLHTPNIRKAKTILPYVDLSAFQPDYRLEILMALHIMDPSLELEKVDAPILKILRDKFRHEQDGSIRGDLMAYQFNVLIDRLERFQFDNWAMAEFVNCINILQNEEKAGRDIGCIYVALHPIFADRRVLKVATPSEKFIKGAGSLWKLKVKKITDFVDRVQAFYESWKAANHTENEEEYEDSDEEEETFEEQEQRKEQDSDEEEQNFEEMEAEEEQESDEEDEYFEIMEEEEQQEHKQEKEKKYELYEESDESDEEEGYSPTTRRHSYWKCKK